MSNLITSDQTDLSGGPTIGDILGTKNNPYTFPSDNKHSEGSVARAIESQTSKLPSDVFLWAALTAMGVSAALQVSGHKKTSNFVGQWAPTLLIFGLYNKIVKVMGSDPKSTR